MLDAISPDSSSTVWRGDSLGSFREAVEPDRVIIERNLGHEVNHLTVCLSTHMQYLYRALHGTENASLPYAHGTRIYLGVP